MFFSFFSIFFVTPCPGSFSHTSDTTDNSIVNTPLKPLEPLEAVYLAFGSFDIMSHLGDKSPPPQKNKKGVNMHF